MNYETATNRELNLRIAELIGLEVNLDKTNMLDGMLVGLRDVIDDIDDDHSIFIDGDFVDYCTDFSATMPLAIEHDISMLSCDGVYEVSCDYEAPVGKFGADETISWYIDAQKDQMLRSIVICLIKVWRRRNEINQRNEQSCIHAPKERNARVRRKS